MVLVVHLHVEDRAPAVVEETQSSRIATESGQLENLLRQTLVLLEDLLQVHASVHPSMWWWGV